ncbi:MAG: flavodoxin [Eubacteriales bacterium]|nr:flavodoxin [Eubacteriales bacterium]
MSKVAVVYWSGSGNTEEMAKKILEGAKAAGAEAELFDADAFSADKVDEFDALAFGCPAMGDEELEDTTFLPLFMSCEEKLKSKKNALFGSYGWGDGEWMRNWESDCKEKGIPLVHEYVICNEQPDDEAQAACEELGKALA